MSEFTEAFWEIAREMSLLWKWLFSMSIIFLVMLAGTALFVQPGSASYYVTILSAAIGVPLALVSGYMVRRCA